MKIDTDNLCEIVIYGLTTEDLIDMAELPIMPINNVENWRNMYQNDCFYIPGKYGNWEEIRFTERFIERVESLKPDCELNDNLFESHYLAYTCFFIEGKLEVTTASNKQSIPQSVADRLVVACSFYEWQFETKKTEKAN